MDGIPVLSQLKSFVQWSTGDSKGAEKTQNNFLKLCPVVSQGTSAIQAIMGDNEGARKTQMEFLEGVNGMVNSVPVVGHAKGVFHYICGDKECGDDAMKAASHTTAVIGGGVGGFLMGGPVGAALLGAVGGALMDEVISVGEIAVNGENAKPYGFVDNVFRIVKDPKNGGNYVDLTGAIVLDGMAGYAAGQGIGKKIEYKLDKTKLAKSVGKDAANQIIDAGEKMRDIHAKNNIKQSKPHVLTKVTDLETGKTFEGHNKQIRQAIKNKNHMTNGSSELQKRVPDARKVISRNPTACAEHQAYNGLYAERPNASPAEIRGVSVKMHNKLKRPVTVARCVNCKEFDSAMGSVPTDLLSETPVPIRVSYGKASLVTAAGVGVNVLTKKSSGQI
ncbi:uncharacterized protein LOC121298252 isoform X2 [Polyodon spathula]|nr:uncharacterized protein LOC121298252 isoform X2 [Polyodon spathula]XP_041081199.1 uncharacterized protein LOC121298252 isoform X2 [Polyodon spathula]